MAGCKNCKDCKDNGCAPLVYSKCILMDKAYPCLGIKVGNTGKNLFDALEAACQAGWGGSNLTFNNGLTKTGTAVQLGGTLIKDTVVLAGAYSFTMATGPSGIINVFEFGPNAGGAGVPGVSIGIRDLATGSGSTATTYLNAGIYTGLYESKNGNNIAHLLLRNNGAVLQFSADNGTTKTIVQARATDINLNGATFPTTATNTQIQETNNSVTAASTLAITTDANVFDVDGVIQIDFISTTSIQPGTRITLRFVDGSPLLIQHGAGSAPAGTANILLNGCENFSPSVDDTLTVVYDGTQWNEVGRKACLDSIETWKTIGSPGTMRNGEPIPAFTGAVNFGSGRIRQIDAKHFEIQLLINVQVGILGAETILNLPTGYQPGATQWQNLSGTYSATTSTYTGVMQFNAGGAVNLAISVFPGANDYDVWGTFYISTD